MDYKYTLIQDNVDPAAPEENAQQAPIGSALPESGPDHSEKLQNEMNIKAARRAVSRNGINLSAFLICANAAAILIELLALTVFVFIQVMHGITDKEAVMDNLSALLSRGNNTAIFTGLLNIVSMHIIAFFAFCIMGIGMKRRNYKKSGLGVGRFIALIPIALFLMSIGSFIGDSLNSIISSLLNLNVSNSTIETIESMPLWLAALATMVCAPIVEEFIFRYTLVGTLGRFGNVFAILISSVAFGLFHGNLYQFFYAFLVGLVLGYVYVKCGRWWVCVLMHAIVNFFGGVLPMMIEKAMTRSEVLKNLANAGEDVNKFALFFNEAAVYSYTVLSLVIFSLGMALTVVALAKKWHKIENDPEIPLPKGSVGKVVFSNVGTIIFLTFSAIFFALTIAIL